MISPVLQNRPSDSNRFLTAKICLWLTTTPYIDLLSFSDIFLRHNKSNALKALYTLTKGNNKWSIKMKAYYIISNLSNTF